jgi:SAM-dependent methyltransferase
MDWHDDDRFWDTFAPALFPNDRVRSAAAEVDAILAMVDTSEVIDVLDLCCGPGRHAIELARRGYRVCGVDRTEAFLERARAEARPQGLDDLELVTADMREFVRPDDFDLALNLYTSFGYFDAAGNRRVLENLYTSLRTGGTLIIDVTSREIVARTFAPRDRHELDDGALWLEERQLQGDGARIRNTWTLVRGGEETSFTFELRLYTGTELTALLTDVGFRDVRTLGHVDGRPYDEAADRLVMVATR